MFGFRVESRKKACAVINITVIKTKRLMKMEDVIYDGKVWRENGKVIVEVVNEPYSLDYGAECINLEAPEDERIYRKVFTRKQIFLPDEYQQAMNVLRSNPADFVLSMNGFSRLTKEWLEKYGIREGAYEQACIAIMKNMIDRLRDEFPGARLHLTYGASDMGVDWAIEEVAGDPKYNLDLLGFSCPRYMLYVKDDHIPVYVSPNSDLYADYYIKSLDFLVSTGGRDQALKHDIMAACIFQKRIHFVNVLSLLSDNNIPAVIIENGETKIENAPAAFETNISSSNINDIPIVVINGDKWSALFENIAAYVIGACRKKMPVDKMFS